MIDSEVHLHYADGEQVKRILNDRQLKAYIEQRISFLVESEGSEATETGYGWDPTYVNEQRNGRLLELEALLDYIEGR